MPDVQELSDGDMDVVERMKSLPDSVLFGEETEDQKAGQERDDAPAAPDEIRDGPEAEAEAEEQKAEEETEQAAPDGDQEFEIPDPEGGEARKVKLSELLDAERKLSAFETEKADIYQREEARGKQAAAQHLSQVEQWSRHAAVQLQAALMLVQQPQPPNIEMRNPASPQYDPDRYETERYRYEQGMGQYNQAQQLAGHLLRQADHLRTSQADEREEAEAQKLLKVWPGFADANGISAEGRAFVDDMNKEYGITQVELDNIFVDHRQAVVARDALKWRKHEAGLKTAKTTLKEKVVAAKPAPKGGATQSSKQTLTTEQSNYMNARKALKANGKDMSAAARGFMRFL